MDEINGDYHEDFFAPGVSETEQEYIKEFLLAPSKHSRNLYGNNANMQPNQHNPQGQGMLYPSNPGLCGTANSNNFPGSNCYESNGGLDGTLPLLDPTGLAASLGPQYLSNMPPLGMPGLPMSSSNLGMSTARLGIQVPSGLGMSVPSNLNLGGNSSVPTRNPYSSSANQFSGSNSNVMGLHPASSSSSLGLHPTPSPGSLSVHSASPSGMGMHSTASPSGMGMHSTASPSGMGMHSTASPSGMGMHSTASPSGMGMHSTASPSGMGMHSTASPSGMGMHSTASPSGMGMHSTASPKGMGMHSTASPSGMGMHSSASPGGMGMHSSASPSGMGMHSSASPGGMGMHSSASPSTRGMPSPAPSLGKPSASPSRASIPVASPNVVNIPSSTARSPLTAAASRSPYRSSPSQFSGASPANIPSASPGRLSMPGASPGSFNILTSSPQEANGLSYSASCSEGNSPAALERLTAGISSSDPSNQPHRTSPFNDPYAISQLEESYLQAGTSGFGTKKDKSQVKKVRRKNLEQNGGKSRKHKEDGSDPHGTSPMVLPSLYNLLTQDNPTEGSPGEGSMLSVGASASLDHFATGSGTVKRGRKRKSGDGAPVRTAPKQRTTVTYHSQISSQNGIKLKIKKSEPVKKPMKPRVRKKKNKSVDSEDSDEGALQRKVNHRPVVESSDDDERAGSLWGTDKLPKRALYNIFKYVTREEGCVPFLVRMQRVCRWWREVALTPDLWSTIEFTGTWVRDRVKNIHTFRWLCENRLTAVQELRLGGWKYSGIPSLLDVIANNCSELRGLNLQGWQGLLLEHVHFLVTNCQKLERLDLSGVNPEAHNNKGAVSLSSLQNVTSLMGDRLTHLILASNKLAGVPLIVSAIAASCPNLQVLDMSNVRTVAHAHANIHIEKLQEGCSKLRVFRITNSMIALAPVTIKEQVESPGFPELEELSVASPNKRTNNLGGSQPYIEDEDIGRILKTSCKLRLLDVRGCNRISDSSLVRIPAWDLEHLYLSGCYATRLPGSGLELITQKWGHSLVELDLAWSTATQALDAAVSALAEVAEKGQESPLRILNLCGSSVSLEPVKAVLLNCLNLISLNLASCRGLPRGMKRNYESVELIELRSQYMKKPVPSPKSEPKPEPEPEIYVKSEKNEDEGEEEAEEEEEEVAAEEEEEEEDDEDEEEEQMSEGETELDEADMKAELESVKSDAEDDAMDSSVEDQKNDSFEVRIGSTTGSEIKDEPEDDRVFTSTPEPGSVPPETTTSVDGSTAGPSGSTPCSGTYSEAGTPGPSDAGTPGGPSGTESGTPGTPGTATTSGTTPQQGTEGDGELLALAQDVKFSLENHMNFSFSELDCGGSLP